MPLGFNPGSGDPPPTASRPGVLIDIPDGPEGTRVTLAIMARLARAGKITMRQLAEQITASAPEKAWYQQAELIHNFVRDKIRYVMDPDGLEMLRSPEKTLEAGNGDCDDKSILEAALLISIGHPARFVAIALEPDNFCHVFVQTMVGNRWVASDTTEAQPFGWEPGVSDGVKIYARLYRPVGQ